MRDDTIPKPKRCPWCGADKTDAFTWSGNRWRVLCLGCGATGPGGDDKPTAIVAWNGPCDFARD